MPSPPVVGDDDDDDNNNDDVDRSIQHQRVVTPRQRAVIQSKLQVKVRSTVSTGAFTGLL